jgi:uncharacterized OB-fold protein
MPDSRSETTSEDAGGFPIRVCPNCGSVYGHPPQICRECGSETLEDDTRPARGRVYASTVVRIPGSDHRGEEPFTVALIDIDGPQPVRITGRIDGEERLTPGSEVVYLRQDEDTYWFRPVE